MRLKDVFSSKHEDELLLRFASDVCGGALFLMSPEHLFRCIMATAVFRKFFTAFDVLLEPLM